MVAYENCCDFSKLFATYSSGCPAFCIRKATVSEIHWLTAMLAFFFFMDRVIGTLSLSLVYAKC